MITRILFLTYLLCPCFAFAHSTQWQSLTQGLSYTQLALPAGGTLHAFRINPMDYQLKLALAKEFRKNRTFVSQFAKKLDSTLAINGGFFTPEAKPLGLRIQNSQILAPLKSTSWWGVFYINNNKAHIVSQKQYKINEKKMKALPSFAVQAGPRLLVDGKIPKLKGDADQRSALCIDSQGNILMMITEGTVVTTTELAKAIQKPYKEAGLNCINALNLDGGHSSQLYAHIGELYLDLPNFTPVSDAIVVFPKTKSF